MNDVSALSDEELLAQLSDEELKALAGMSEASGSMPPASPMQAAAGSAINQALLGYLPQVQAGAETRSLSSPEYIARRDALISELESAQQQQPIASALGGFVGAAGVPLGFGSAAGKTARTAGQLFKQAAASGAILGAAQNPGDVQGQVSDAQLEERLKNAGLGGFLGGAVGYGLGTVATPGGRRAIKDIAEERAFKSTGPYAREARQAYSRGKIRPIGRAMLDEGVIGNIPPGYETIQKRAKAAAERVGAEKGAVIDELAEFEKRLADAFKSEAGGNFPAKVGQGLAKDVTANVGISRAEVSKALRERLISELPEASRQNAKIQSLIKKFESGAPYMSIKEADKLKQQYKNMINWDRLPGADIPVEEQYYRAAYSAMNKGVDDAATALADSYSDVVGKDMRGKLARSKQRYGALKTAQEISEKREGRERALRMVSPSDYASGIGGAAIAAGMGKEAPEMLVIGAIAGAGNQLARKYGNQLTAKQLDNLQRMFANVRARAGIGTAGAIGGAVTMPTRNRRLKALEGK